MWLVELTILENGPGIGTRPRESLGYAKTNALL
jgi:hypothetical protein